MQNAQSEVFLSILEITYVITTNINAMEVVGEVDRTASIRRRGDIPQTIGLQPPHQSEKKN